MFTRKFVRVLIRETGVGLALWLAAWAVILGITTLAGCTLGPSAAATADGASAAFGPGGLPGAVAAARAAGNPVVASTAAALRAASGLNLVGALAIVVGFVYGAVPRLPTGPGVGFALGGAACLLCGVFLPLLSGWVGLLLLAVSALLALAKHGAFRRLIHLIRPRENVS